MRQAFQVSLLLVAFVPFVLGAMTLFEGAARIMPLDEMTATLDGQIRFWGIRSMLPFLLTIWTVRNLESAETVLIILLAATAAGGLARTYSVVEYGAPDPALIGVIVFEIGVLLFIPWYRLIVRNAEAVAST